MAEFSSSRTITVPMLVLLNVSIMASLRNLPLVAEYGYSALFFFFVVGILFLVPSALVSAELATGWPKSGGIYIWVREAFGNKWGFFAIWMQWAHNLTWYPAILSFVAATLAYMMNPALADNPLFIIAIVLTSYWGMTYLNYRGIKTSGLFSSIGVVAGTILPGVFIILLAIYYVTTGNPVQIQFTAKSLIPDITRIQNLVFLGGFFLAFAGLEVSAGYAGEVHEPQKNFPKAIIIAAIIVFFLFMLGSLSVAYVIPGKEIQLVTGLMEAFKTFLDFYHLGFLLPVIGSLLILGAIAEVNAWIIGPIKALHMASLHGNLPPYFQKLNPHGVPTRLLFYQAIIVSFVSLIFLFLPSVSTSYWALTAIAAQMYLIMYVMMFIAAIRLRYARPDVPRPYKIPHPHKGIWLVASVGVLGSILGITLTCIPPSQIPTGNILLYESFIILGVLSMVALPFIFHRFKKPEWLKLPE
ncbi:MAG: amino acid permease [Candidatus Algichlamydia australiensis]|nr:amino acid permease [Chlamydiales bacterium]